MCVCRPCRTNQHMLIGVSVHQQRAPTSLDESVTLKESERKSFACNYCGKKLACLKNLTTHMRVHTGEKPFVCMLCGKRFSDSSNLKRHQSVHTGEKRYSCVHCGKRFAQSGSLKVHMTVNHGNNRHQTLRQEVLLVEQTCL
uniref:C2H2-type domain-containing protein n=1 Tax=Gouania willdenowi TaxID=441366 RepID=A0A8C5H5Z9_GOUWI